MEPAAPSRVAKVRGLAEAARALSSWVGLLPKRTGDCSPPMVGAAPPYQLTPRVRSLLVETSMITASTKTWKRGTSSWAMTRCMEAKSLLDAVMTRLLVALSAVTRTSP